MVTVGMFRLQVKFLLAVDKVPEEVGVAAASGEEDLGCG